MRWWLLLILWTWAGTGPVFSQVLKVGVNDGNGEPYAFIEDGKVVGGIIKDISDAVGKALGRSVVYEVLPRKRLETALTLGDIDMIPIYNPSWAEAPEKLQWSPALFDERNRIVVPATRQTPVLNVGDLDGQTLGTIRGYFYPTLEEALLRPDGPVREDVANLPQNLLKLLLGRIDAVVDSEILLDWQLRDAEQTHHGLVLAPWVVSSQKIHWAYSTRSGISPATVNRAFQQLKDSGAIDRILKTYQ